MPLRSLNNTPALEQTMQSPLMQDGARRPIDLLCADAALTADLSHQLSHFGYPLQTFSQIEEFIASLQTQLPRALLVDLTSISIGERLNHLLLDLKSRHKNLPFIFISNDDDLLARLAAVRLGSDAYLRKPIDIVTLVDRIDALNTEQSNDPYRILIVEDSVPSAMVYASILKNAQMIVEVVTDPLQVIQPLNEFRPDLILMDLYMPGCDGIELAKALRQQDAYLALPIVFISGEAKLEEQNAALRMGGEHFLNKPVSPEELLWVVASRADRSRAMRIFMVRDSLTGLLNHTATTSQLVVEIARAQRQHTGLAVAMLDLDRFKSLNDTYGHPIGDRVLKSLARLLQERLRKTDVIGRYGGEEFAIVLPGATGAAAFRVMEEVREAFQKIRHSASDSAEFTCSLSCGIATYPEYTDSAAVIMAADKALYEAKRLGRNRVILAEPTLVHLPTMPPSPHPPSTHADAASSARAE